MPPSRSGRLLFRAKPGLAKAFIHVDAIVITIARHVVDALALAAEIRRPRSVGTGGDRRPPVTRWALRNGPSYREHSAETATPYGRKAFSERRYHDWRGSSVQRGFLAPSLRKCDIGTSLQTLIALFGRIW